MNGIVRLRYGGSDQAVAIPNHRYVSCLGNQTFCRNGDGLLGIGDKRSSLIRVRIRRNRQIRARYVEGFRKGHGGRVIFKLRLHQLRTALVVFYLVFGTVLDLNFHDLRTACRRRQRCGNVHIVCADAQVRARGIFNRDAISAVRLCRSDCDRHT